MKSSIHCSRSALSVVLTWLYLNAVASLFQLWLGVAEKCSFDARIQRRGDFRDPGYNETSLLLSTSKTYHGASEADGSPLTYSSLTSEMKEAFTRNGTIPVEDFYVDDSNRSKGTRYEFGKSEIEEWILRAEKLVSASSLALEHRVKDGAAAARGLGPQRLRALRSRSSRGLIPVRPSSAVFLLSALDRAVSVASIGGTMNWTAAVMGSTSPWIECLLLAYGASSVVTFEHNELVYEHNKIMTVKVGEVGVAELYARSFDIVVSQSSFDHSGLGRYGDPISPDADFDAMVFCYKLLRKEGSALVMTVPVGPDLLAWNLMRVYGRIRLPLLLTASGSRRRGWHLDSCHGWEGAALLRAYPGYNFRMTFEPAFVLLRGAWGEGEGQDYPRDKMCTSREFLVPKPFPLERDLPQGADQKQGDACEVEERTQTFAFEAFLEELGLAWHNKIQSN